MKHKNWKKSFLHFWVLSCDKATLLMEKELRSSLSPLERLQLRIHLSLCKNCTCYHQKAQFLDAYLRHAPMASRKVFSKEEIQVFQQRLRAQK